MGAWQLVENEALQSSGWFLWRRKCREFGFLYQTSSRADLTPKGVGYLSFDLLIATKKHTAKTIH